MNPFAGKFGAQRKPKIVCEFAPVFPKEWMQSPNSLWLSSMWTGGGCGDKNSVCVATPAPAQNRNADTKINS